MAKQCTGKYHGSGIKYIDDNEKYCKICQQHYRLNKKRIRETSSVITAIGGVLAIIVNVVLKKRNGNGSS